MRIVSFNVQHGRTPAGPVDNAGLARYCAALGADVLALQEVDVGLGRSGRVDQAAVVAEATGLVMAFAPARRWGLRGRYGNALLARGSLAGVETLYLPRMGRHERRVAAIASARVDGHRLSIAATHLSVLPEEAARQLEIVLDALAARPAPHLLLGDLNLGPEQVVPALEARRFIVAAPTAPTFPARAPSRRIDHVAVAGLDVEEVRVLDAAPVSDHRPLLVLCRLNSGERS